MKAFFQVMFLILVAACAALPALGQQDTPGSKDYPGITRMPGYYIYEYTDRQFDSVSMPVKEGAQRKEVAVEGHVYKIHYFIKDGAPATSMLQVVRNYQNAVRVSGGQVVDDQVGGNWCSTTLRISKNHMQVWIYLYARDDNHELTIVEKQAMQQEVTVDVEALARDLNETGKVAIYGIYFDTGKSELKPESQPAIEAIAKLLKQTPGLKVFIVGHTDMVGDPVMNVKLSQARAQSVVNALVTTQGIASSQLIPFGNGPYAPVASNRTEEGRAKNRRVELVEVATQ
jgi:outer membrane protein OmpA-like peptidoglycan-associated protein